MSLSIQNKMSRLQEDRLMKEDLLINTEVNQSRQEEEIHKRTGKERRLKKKRASLSINTCAAIGAVGAKQHALLITL